jgi:hypothetical protein
MATHVPLQRADVQALPVAHAVPALAGLAGAAGLIHLIAMIEHVGVEWTLALFFAAVGIGQMAAAWLIYRQGAGTRLLALAAAGSVAIALLWLFSRTTGLSFGPEQGRRDVGVGDTIASVLEVAFAGLAGLRLWRGDERLAWLSSGMGIRLTWALLSLSLMMAAFGGHEH